MPKYTDYYYKSFITRPRKGTIVNKYFYVDKATKTLVGLTTEGLKQTTLNLTDLDITSIGKGAFMNAQATSITLPDFISNIPYGCFYNCNNLKTINIGFGIKNIEDYAFANGPIDQKINFVDYYIPNWSPKSFINYNIYTYTKHVNLNFSYCKEDFILSDLINKMKSLVKNNTTIYKFSFTDGYFDNNYNWHPY